jgi:hypothetical protein
MGPRYYDIDGNPLEMMEWAELFEQRVEAGHWWRIGQTKVGDVEISTVWMGIDHSFWGDGPPLIFETMVFGGPLSGECERYSTKEEARDGHAYWVAAVDQATARQSQAP